MGRVMSVFEAEVGSLHGTLFALCTTLDFSSSLTTAYIGWRRRRGGELFSSTNLVRVASQVIFVIISI